MGAAFVVDRGYVMVEVGGEGLGRAVHCFAPAASKSTAPTTPCSQRPPDNVTLAGQEQGEQEVCRVSRALSAFSSEYPREYGAAIPCDG